MSVAGIVNGVYIVSGMLAGHGTQEQKERLPAEARRGRALCCFMMTEPEAGSDVRAIRTTARREGDELVVNGQKMWVTNGARAGLMALLVKTDPKTDPPQAGMTALIVEKEPGAGKQGGITIPRRGPAEARLQGRRVDRGDLRRPSRAGLDDPRRAGGRGRRASTR